jgi:hypothetical protein
MHMKLKIFAPLMLASVACGGDDMEMATAGVPGLTSVGTTGEEDDSEEVGESGKLDVGAVADLPGQEPEECVSESSEASLVPKPVDVIVFVDTSGSMNEESNSVEMNLNRLLTAIVEQQDMIDVRVIVVAMYGTGEAMCIAAPLGPDDCTAPGPLAPLGPQLYQYSVGLGSGSFLDAIMTTYTGEAVANPAHYDTPPVGWQEWARPEALKAIIGVTDAASMSGNAALGDTFDAQLLALSPEQFGTAEERNYVLHAIAGFGPNTPDTTPFPPDAPIVTTECGGGTEPGQPLQQVAIITGGLRFPLCRYENFDTLFDEIAVNVGELTPVACDIAVPEPPEGETLDPNTLEVEYLPAGVAPAEVFHQVPSEAECEDDAFWVDATSIHLCPTACTLVQSDAMARVDIRYGCDVGYEPSG